MDDSGLTLTTRTPHLPAPLPATALRVGWVGAAPPWLHAANGQPFPSIAFEQVSPAELLGRNGSPPPAVLHVVAGELSRLRGLRQAAPNSALVLDLTSSDELPLRRRAGRRLAPADLVLVGSLAALRELRRRHPWLALRTALLRPPVNLDRYAPEEVVRRSRGAELARLRKAHGLDGGVVLFVGPFTEEGGLDVAIRAVARLRKRVPGVRLAALPHGRSDPRYAARVLGSADEVVVAVAASEEDAALWYAAASVVCLPSRAAVTGEPARLAAAAGQPFVGSEVDSLFEHVVEGETGYLVPTNDAERLAGALARLLTDDEERRRLGAAARRRAEREFAVDAARRRLTQLWAAAAEGHVHTHLE